MRQVFMFTKISKTSSKNYISLSLSGSNLLKRLQGAGRIIQISRLSKLSRGDEAEC